ncbi:MAG: glycogen synthase GlgA [Elusimicrobia bacterium]|nr:glycogen synthase GlgA [Elusimicrobiota bacterium]
MKILFAASEAVPFCKTGGLGDVVGALAEALKTRGHDVRLVLPHYCPPGSDDEPPGSGPLSLTIPVDGRDHPVRVWETRFGPDVPAYLIDSPGHFAREGLYRDSRGVDYADNDRRYILFCRAALETARAVGFAPDVVHAHDWQTGLLPTYLATLYRDDPFFKNTATVFSIHNIAYQGHFPKETLLAAGLDWSWFTADRLEYFDGFNFLKAALVTADVLSTVSPTYAAEVQSGEEFGRGMEGVLQTRSRDFFGVLNGIDNALWNPAVDAMIARPFTARALRGRAECKRDLQRQTGLTEDEKAPLLGMVSRLDPQKGFDILLDVLEPFVEEGAQAVFLGQGSPVYQATLRTLSRKHPGRVASSTDFNETLAHKIYAGADIFLMPSRFEPCGLGQMIALRYGAVPVVTPTGGLKDTVIPVSRDGKKGDGFVAAATETAAYRRALETAVDRFRRDPAGWKRILKRGMARAFDWADSVPKYEDLYRRALAHRTERVEAP